MLIKTVIHFIFSACAGVGGGGGGVQFELWCRYYYPNVRDQVIAKVNRCSVIFCWVQRILSVMFAPIFVFCPCGLLFLPCEMKIILSYPCFMQGLLPLAKLCGMVTMHRRGESSTQTFSLPLTSVSTDGTGQLQMDKVGICVLLHNWVCHPDSRYCYYSGALSSDQVNVTYLKIEQP